jgi:hypothetical protein
MYVILSMFILKNYALRDFKLIIIITVVTAMVLPFINILVVLVLNIYITLLAS